MDAAQKAGVGYLAYTSRALKDPSTLANELMVRHFQTEAYIQASGLPYVLFRNILYMDVLPLFTGPHVLETGIRLPAGQEKVAYALRSEMGEAIANVLLENARDNRIYHFTGQQAYSFDDVAAALTAASGTPVAYTPVDAATFAAGMRARGVPEVAIERTIGFMTDIKHGQETTVSMDLETALGRPHGAGRRRKAAIQALTPAPYRKPSFRRSASLIVPNWLPCSAVSNCRPL